LPELAQSQEDHLALLAYFELNQSGGQVHFKQMTGLKDCEIHLYSKVEVFYGKKETKMGFACITGIRWILS